MDEINVFAQRIKEARMKAGLSQAELSRQTGVAPATLSSYEITNSTKRPTIEKVVLIAKALNVSVDWLCGLKDSPEIEPEQAPLSVDVELLLRVIAEYVTHPYKNGTKIELYDYRRSDQCLKLTNPFVYDFVEKTQQMKMLKDDGVIAPDVFEGCIEQLILKTAEKIEKDKDLVAVDDDDLPF